MPTQTPSPLRGSARVLRAGLMGTWTVLLAMVGHHLGGGEWAPLAVLVPVALAASAAAFVLTGRRVSALGAAALIGVAQLVVHLMAAYVHGHVMLPSVLMLAGHVAAAALTGLLLARADALWWAVLAPLVAVLRLVLPPVPTRSPVPRIVRWAPPTPLVLAHAVVRRGPPLA